MFSQKCNGSRHNDAGKHKDDVVLKLSLTQINVVASDFGSKNYRHKKVKPPKCI